MPVKPVRMRTCASRPRAGPGPALSAGIELDQAGGPQADITSERVENSKASCIGLATVALMPIPS